ncbi:glycosyltransferase [Clostridium sp.]|uniref:glycosyltransferase n=1 Tax=Clostridium sp. TaxID=1506 RepID=UPI0034646682
MKILQINSVCGFGSTGRIATDLYKVLEEQGHECVIAYGRGTSPEGIKSIKIGRNLDNYLHVAKTRIFDKHGFGSTIATKKFIKKVEEYDPDIIHLHNIHGYYINIEILFEYLKKSKKPVVWTLHDCWTFTGHCSHFDYVECDKWRISCENCSQRSEYPSSMICDNSRYNYNEKKGLFTSLDNITVITPSNWLANLVKQSFLGRYPVKVINNGIDLDVFKPVGGNFKAKYNIQDKFVILGVASVWDKRKGFDDFIKLSKVIGEDYRIVLIGIDDNQISKLTTNMIGIKRTDDINELRDIYSTVDVFINTSVEETFGLVTIEAMACGTPVIAYNATAIPEVLTPKCGYVVEKNNVNEVLKAIKNIEVKGKDFYSQHCIDRARINYKKVDKYNEYIELYNSIVDSKDSE